MMGRRFRDREQPQAVQQAQPSPAWLADTVPGQSCRANTLPAKREGSRSGSTEHLRPYEPHRGRSRSRTSVRRADWGAACDAADALRLRVPVADDEDRTVPGPSRRILRPAHHSRHARGSSPRTRRMGGLARVRTMVRLRLHYSRGLECAKQGIMVTAVGAAARPVARDRGAGFCTSRRGSASAPTEDATSRQGSTSRGSGAPPGGDGAVRRAPDSDERKKQQETEDAAVSRAVTEQRLGFPDRRSSQPTKSASGARGQRQKNTGKDRRKTGQRLEGSATQPCRGEITFQSSDPTSGLGPGPRCRTICTYLYR